MVYKTHLDYHMGTPNLPEIKSYVDSANAQKIISQLLPSSGADNASPFASDDISAFSAPFSANDKAQARFVPHVDSKPGFSWKTIVLCVSVFAAVAAFYYHNHIQIEYSVNSAGYEMQRVVDRIQSNFRVNDATKYVMDWCCNLLAKPT